MAIGMAAGTALSTLSGGLAGLGNVGGFLGGLGSLAGGLGLGKSGNIRGGEMKKLSRLNIQHELTRLQRLRDEGGIHPLFAMGSSAGITPILSGQNQDYETAAAGVEKMARAVAPGKQDPTQQAMVALGLRQAEAETARSEFSAELARLELAREKQRNVANQERSAGVVPVTDARNIPRQEIKVSPAVRPGTIASLVRTPWGEIEVPAGFSPAEDVENAVGDVPGYGLANLIGIGGHHLGGAVARWLATEAYKKGRRKPRKRREYYK